MPVPEQGAFVRRLQLPTDHCFHLCGPTGHPSLHKKAWRIDFNVFASGLKGTTLAIETGAPPRSAGV